MKLKNIESLIDGNGNITIGRIGPVHCAAIAGDEDQQLASLVRDRGESLQRFLERLDKAIGRAWNDEVFIDEINGDC